MTDSGADAAPPMEARRRILILIAVMATVAVVVGATAIAVLYATAVDQERLRLQETAQSQARLMEAMARFDRQYSKHPDGPTAATVAQIRDAHESFRRQGLGETGEFTVARRDGDSMVFLVAFRHAAEGPPTLPFESHLAEPMRRALSGQSGTVIAADYYGHRVLAAYEPVAVLDLGIVAKIDLEEIRAPFVRASALVAGVGMAAILLGTLAFRRLGEPMVRRLGERESRFRQLFQSMQSGGAVFAAVDGGADFVFRDFNRAAERIEAIDREAAIGRRITELFPGAQAFGLVDLLRRVWQSGAPERLPARLYADDRVSGWREVSAYKLPNGEIVALFDDVTAREDAEAALVGSQLRMRALLDASQDEILLLSTTGEVLAVNEAAKRRLAPGLGGREPVGARLDQLLPEDQVAWRMEAVRRVADTATFAHFDAPIRARWFEFWFYPVLRPDAPVSEVAVFAREITARKRDEDDLRSLWQAIDQSPVSVVITDADGVIRYVNPCFTRVTGYARDEAIGRKPNVLKSGTMPPEVYTDLWRTITAGNVWTGELHNRKKNGELFWEFASIAPIKEKDGRIGRFVAVKEDITGRKVTEDQLRQAQKMEAVGQLTGGIAHDFNNLLAIILGNLQLLQERLGDGADTGELIQDALWSARHGAELTHRLLAFARRQPLNPDVVDLNAVVHGTGDLLRRSLGAGVEVRERLAPDLWPAFADRGELERALVNLAVNGRDAMPKGGVLTLETRNIVLGEDYAEQVEEVAAGDYALLAVTDSGTGMPPDVLSRVFEPFFTTKPVGRGSGLGLSMVYGFARQSGGHVSIYSEVGHGTTVKLFLPRAPAVGERPSAPASAHGPAPGFGYRVVLVVEDEPKLRKVAVAMLRKLGLAVIEAGTADEAMLRLEATPQIDILFTDIELPGGTNGLALASAVRKRRPGIRVIYTTGYAEHAVLPDSGGGGGSAVVAKPYSLETLARAVRAALAA
jgi:PAS domain S-box-containing protein